MQSVYFSALMSGTIIDANWSKQTVRSFVRAAQQSVHCNETVFLGS